MIYASYKARYEDEIIRSMIRNDEGKGNVSIIYPDKLGIWNTLIKGSADATWIFLNWEGIEAKGRKIDLNTFQLKDFGIPYSYSPVIALSEMTIESKSEIVRSFIEATKKGFLFAQSHPEEAAKILSSVVPSGDAHIDLIEAIRFSSAYFGDESNWGLMNIDGVTEYLNWIYRHQLETQRLSAHHLITNELNVAPSDSIKA
jgi:ABC-type nitrate/sulfonate/bicarbonate transport system substrate-binding protein